MDYYFLTTYHTAPKNRKANDAVDFCRQYSQILVEGRMGLDAIRAELRAMCKQLNEKYPKSRALFADGVEDTHLTLKFEQDVHNNVFQITITKVRGFYRFSENNLKQITD